MWLFGFLQHRSSWSVAPMLCDLECGLCWPGACRQSKLFKQVGGRKLAEAGVAGTTWYPAAALARGGAQWSLWSSCHSNLPLLSCSWCRTGHVRLSCSSMVWWAGSGRMVSSYLLAVGGQQQGFVLSKLLQPLISSSLAHPLQSPPSLGTHISAPCTAYCIFCLCCWAGSQPWEPLYGLSQWLPAAQGFWCIFFKYMRYEFFVCMYRSSWCTEQFGG